MLIYEHLQSKCSGQNWTLLYNIVQQIKTDPATVGPAGPRATPMQNIIN